MTSQTTMTTQAKTPNVGDKAPNIVLVNGKGADGKATYFNLHETCKKGPVIVAFFPGAFTGTCTKEMCSFSDTWQEFATLGAQFVGVSVDSWHAQKAFADKHNIKVPFASDFERKTTNEWNVAAPFWWGPVARRATFIVDKTGVVRYANVQADSNVEPNYAEVKAALAKLK